MERGDRAVVGGPVTGSALVYTAPLKVKGRSERLGRADGLPEMDPVVLVLGEAGRAPPIEGAGDALAAREPANETAGEWLPDRERVGLELVVGVAAREPATDAAGERLPDRERVRLELVVGVAAREPATDAAGERLPDRERVRLELVVGVAAREPATDAAPLLVLETVGEPLLLRVAEVGPLQLRVGLTVALKVGWAAARGA